MIWIVQRGRHAYWYASDMVVFGRQQDGYLWKMQSVVLSFSFLRPPIIAPMRDHSHLGIRHSVSVHLFYTWSIWSLGHWWRNFCMKRLMGCPGNARIRCMWWIWERCSGRTWGLILESEKGFVGGFECSHDFCSCLQSVLGGSGKREKNKAVHLFAHGASSLNLEQPAWEV